MKQIKRSFKKLPLSLAGIDIIAYTISFLIMLFALYLAIKGTSYYIVYFLTCFAVAGLLFYEFYQLRKAKK